VRLENVTEMDKGASEQGAERSCQKNRWRLGHRGERSFASSVHGIRQIHQPNHGKGT